MYFSYLQMHNILFISSDTPWTNHSFTKEFLFNQNNLKFCYLFVINFVVGYMSNIIIYKPYSIFDLNSYTKTIYLLFLCQHTIEDLNNYTTKIYIKKFKMIFSDIQKTFFKMSSIHVVSTPETILKKWKIDIKKF